MSLILGIETSCDETAAAVVADGRDVLSNIVASQVHLHAKFGGVVPEIASRAHIESIIPVVSEAMQQAGVLPRQLAAIAVTNRPGLVGSLLIGVSAAKTLAWAWRLPLVAVDHVRAHLYSLALGRGPERVFPAVGLVVSGGHSSLYHCRDPLDCRLLGATTDDAAGEAFDKVAALLQLGYPGGPAIERAAAVGDADAVRLPRTLLGPVSLDFSFSGIKTAVLYYLRGQDMKGEPLELTPKLVADVAASFQAAVVDVLVTKLLRAAERVGLDRLIVGGGVAANSALRRRLTREAEQRGYELLLPERRFCTDNAAMVAGLGFARWRAGLFEPLTLEAISQPSDG